jgi:hypothetical protein
MSELINQDIFDLAASNKEQEFISTVLQTELDAFGDIMDSLASFPFIGFFIKCGVIGKRYFDFRFIQKIARFLSNGQEIPIDKKVKFLDSLTPKRRKKIFDYVIHYLFHAEDDEKADIMGFIYRARVLDEIDDEMFLRLCSIVNRSFISDFKALPKYIEENRENSIEAQNFINLGLIDNYIGGVWKDYDSYELNQVGRKLHEILNSVGWFDS